MVTTIQYTNQSWNWKVKLYRQKFLISTRCEGQSNFIAREKEFLLVIRSGYFFFWCYFFRRESWDALKIRISREFLIFRDDPCVFFFHLLHTCVVLPERLLSERYGGYKSLGRRLEIQETMIKSAGKGVISDQNLPK